VGYTPATKIKLIMDVKNHLENHPVNVAIKTINNFISHAFKIKGKDDYDVSTIINLGKQLGIVYPKTQIFDINFLRSREFLSFSKEKILRYLYNAINKSNGDNLPDNSKSLAPFHQNRFYVGRGNNSILVRSVIKQRWWWSMNEKENFMNSNFVWTQWRKNKHLAILNTTKQVTNQAMVQLKAQVYEELKEEEEDKSEEEKDENNKITDIQEDLFKKKIYNRLEDNYHLSNKKALFWNLSEYYKSISK
jgi:hypothetical protein